MTRAESDYAALLKLIAGCPKRLRKAVAEGLEGLLDDVAERVVEGRNPRTLDDIRRWPADKHLAEIGIHFLIDRYADEVHGYDKYALLPCDEWPEDAWCPDGYFSGLADIGVEAVLSSASLHTVEDLIGWLDSRYPEPGPAVFCEGPRSIQ